MTPRWLRSQERTLWDAFSPFALPMAKSGNMMCELRDEQPVTTQSWRRAKCSRTWFRVKWTRIICTWSPRKAIQSCSIVDSIIALCAKCQALRALHVLQLYCPGTESSSWSQGAVTGTYASTTWRKRIRKIVAVDQPTWNRESIAFLPHHADRTIDCRSQLTTFT